MVRPMPPSRSPNDRDSLLAESALSSVGESLMLALGPAVDIWAVAGDAKPAIDMMASRMWVGETILKGQICGRCSTRSPKHRALHDFNSRSLDSKRGVYVASK